jgi:hypothetical protein
MLPRLSKWWIVLALISTSAAVAAGDDSKSSDEKSADPALANSAGTPVDFLPADAGQDSYRRFEPQPLGPDEPAIEIAGAATPRLVTIAVIENPAIAFHSYRVYGRIKYEDVSAPAHVELWNDFGDRGSYFTRTLAEVGPMRRILGSSNWRDIQLPFSAEPGMRPETLTIKVQLNSEGKIWFGPLFLKAVDPAIPQSGWWNEGDAGVVGGIAGGVLGFCGALVGILTGVGRGKTIVLSCVAACVIVGLGALAAGIAGVASGQPYHVWYPLIQLGSISALVFGPLVPVIRCRFRQTELRRIAALDA